LRARPLGQAWQAIIERNVWHWRYLSPAQQQRLAGQIQVFVAEKSWEGVRGLVVNDEMRVTIAGAACLLLLGFRDDYCFDGVRTILVSPTGFKERQSDDDWELGGQHPTYAIGQAWQGGPIILSWRDVRYECRQPGAGHNVVVHEFAHHVDSLDGEMGGTPPLTSASLRQNWQRVMAAEYERLREAVAIGLPTALDEYGLANQAELFAVASEAFFCRPVELQTEHEELYALLAELYQLDPASWFE
jgi:Mlc titration factor MtfA (ptsG expression regulator)